MKQVIPFVAADISALAKSLRKQLMACEQFPTHVEMLNLLAKASGHQNFQQLKAQQLPLEADESGLDPLAVDIPAKLKPFMGQDYVLRQWPGRYALQQQSLWFFWCRFRYGVEYSEAEVNALLKPFIGFGDHPLIRRELVNKSLLGRTDDGGRYWRQSAIPPAGFERLADVW
ncbi:DUF2087 domain-containing protein [Shewanella zhangzhouensis]|uniref:DUF2087 domain-containing protein n=1 Tax=Shewanella zhangzhouensis TaxID=2864213 RepID=UPI001C6582A0|nr:DUF2087 domain-containing protein [Shewanella zhangzhouensis]QYK05432.1 DUF2087 domain-containing protein [Shewanella zhangzhouensis]